MSPQGDPDRTPGLTDASVVDAVRQLYDRWATLYDWNPVLALVRPARRRAVRQMDLSSGDTVVDMGTGTGANLPFLREAVGPEGAVIGIDVSPEMLDRARDRVDDAGWENVTLVEGDIRDPPLAGPVDGILSSFVIVMYDQPGRLVETWAEFLDGGPLANLYAGPSQRRVVAPAVNALLELYLRLFEEGWGTAAADSGPLGLLARRGERARAALERSSGRVEHDAAVFGLVRLDVGRIDAFRSP